jgi:hypothetical protein
MKMPKILKRVALKNGNFINVPEGLSDGDQRRAAQGGTRGDGAVSLGFCRRNSRIF